VSISAVGRPKKFTEQTPARFPEGTLARIDAVLVKGESRSDFLAKAAEAEIRKRLRSRQKETAQSGVLVAEPDSVGATLVDDPDACCDAPDQ